MVSSSCPRATFPGRFRHKLIWAGSVSMRRRHNFVQIRKLVLEVNSRIGAAYRNKIVVNTPPHTYRHVRSLMHPPFPSLHARGAGRGPLFAHCPPDPAPMAPAGSGSSASAHARYQCQSWQTGFVFLTSADFVGSPPSLSSPPPTVSAFRRLSL